MHFICFEHGNVRRSIWEHVARSFTEHGVGILATRTTRPHEFSENRISNEADRISNEGDRISKEGAYDMTENSQKSGALKILSSMPKKCGSGA